MLLALPVIALWLVLPVVSWLALLLSLRLVLGWTLGQVGIISIFRCCARPLLLFSHVSMLRTFAVWGSLRRKRGRWDIACRWLRKSSPVMLRRRCPWVFSTRVLWIVRES